MDIREFLYCIRIPIFCLFPGVYLGTIGQGCQSSSDLLHNKIHPHFTILLLYLIIVKYIGRIAHFRGIFFPIVEREKSKKYPDSCLRFKLVKILVNILVNIQINIQVSIHYAHLLEFPPVT